MLYGKLSRNLGINNFPTNDTSVGDSALRSKATEYFTLNLYNFTIDRRRFATVVQSTVIDVILNLDELKTKDIFMFGKIFWYKSRSCLPVDHDLFKQSLTGLCDGIWPFFASFNLYTVTGWDNLMMFLYWGIYTESAPKHVTSCQLASQPHCWLAPLRIASMLFSSVIQHWSDYSHPTFPLKIQEVFMREARSKSIYAWPHTSYPHTWISIEIFSKTHLSLCWYL